MVEPVKHDWPTLIREIFAAFGLLRQRKCTDYKLALMIPETDKKMVRRWRLGKSKPDHFRGEYILAIHAEFHRELGSRRPHANLTACS